VAGSTALAYAAADETAKDAWLADNADRVLFGAAVSNNSANDHSASLENIDATADRFTSAPMKLMKRLAKVATPKIRPIKTDGDEEWYVLFAGSNTFRDFENDPAVQQANREAWQRGQDNPLFTGGDLILSGCIVREVPEIDDIAGVGAGGIDVGPVYLCGAQALGELWKERSKMIEDISDYGRRKGAGFEEVRDIKKLYFGKGASDRDDLVQHGVLTGFFASVDDA
jgi:N4-gp56 family major capsid protein